jgi:hypothetical protein
MLPAAMKISAAMTVALSDGATQQCQYDARRKIKSDQRPNIAQSDVKLPGNERSN